MSWFKILYVNLKICNVLFSFFPIFSILLQFKSRFDNFAYFSYVFRYLFSFGNIFSVLTLSRLGYFCLIYRGRGSFRIRGEGCFPPFPPMILTLHVRSGSVIQVPSPALHVLNIIFNGFLNI